MASPFHIFRKYQKTLLVIAGVLLMFVFVVGDSLTQFIGNTSGSQATGGARPTDVAVQWEDGELTNRELANLVQRREIIKLFLTRLFQAGQAAAIDAGADPQMPLSVELVAVGEPAAAAKENAVRTKLLADAARQVGMDVSDENIRHYLMEVGRRRVSTDEMRNLLQHSEFQGGRIPIDWVFDVLRDELLARNYLASYAFAMRSVEPQQRWQDWLRVNERVTAEVASLPVSQFVVDVPDPSEEELTAFFNEFKSREPLPEVVDNTELPSPNPGFAIPRRVKLHFVKADFNDVVARLAEEVTGAEIEKYYEENKDTYFVKADTDFELEAPAEDQVDGETEAPGDESQPDDDAAQSEVQENAADQESTADEPVDLTEAEASESEDVEEEEEEEEAPPQGQQEPETSDSAADGETTSEAFDAGVSDADAEADAATAEPEDDTAAGAVDDDAEADVAEDKPVEYQPLDEVREEIRQALAQEKAATVLPERMGEVYAELRKAYQAWEAKVFAAEDAGKEPPPPPEELVELSPLAEAHGMDAQKTGDLSRVELRDTPLGKSGNPQRFGNAALWLAEFTELELNEPVMTYDLDFNHYVSVKVLDIPERIPPLDEVRDEVNRAWKLREAAELALERAKEAAEEAELSGVPLSEKFADDSRFKVTTTDSFSWLTIGNISPTTNQVFFRMSEPAGVVAAGPDFMREVFSLEQNEVGAVLNHDHSIAYVVRIAERQETREQLQRVFLSEADRWYGLPSMLSFHQRQAAQALVADLFESHHVEWLQTEEELVE